MYTEGGASGLDVAVGRRHPDDGAVAEVGRGQVSDGVEVGPLGAAPAGPGKLCGLAVGKVALGALAPLLAQDTVLPQE